MNISKALLVSTAIGNNVAAGQKTRPRRELPTRTYPLIQLPKLLQRFSKTAPNRKNLRFGADSK